MMKIGKAKSAAALLLAVLTITLIACTSKPVDDGKVAITTKSDKARELFVQARGLVERLRITESLPLLEQALSLDSNFTQAHLLMTQAAPSAAVFFSSLDNARRSAAVATEPERLMVQVTHAGVNGNTAEQEGVLKKLLTLRPQDERVQMLMGNFYFGQQHWPEAIATYQKAVAIDSNFSPVYNQLGYCYRFAGRNDDAEVAFKKYIQLIPDDPNPYDSYAELLMKLGRYEESIAQYEKALKVQLTFQPSYFGIASNLNFLGRHQEARDRMQQFYGIAENDGQRRAAYAGMAISAVDEGNFDVALESLQKMTDIAVAAGDYAAQSGDVNLLGNVYLEMGRYEDALKKFKETVDLQAKAKNNSAELNDQARLNYQFDAGRVAAWTGDLVQAKQLQSAYLTRAEASQNSFQIWQAHQLAGIIAMKEQRWNDAISELNKSNPQNPFNLWLISEAYRSMGDEPHAQEYASKATNYNLVNSLLQSMARRRVANLQGKA
jgi:tetratricopeptide (TPR) repeat protein